jgi:hypothetical protein
METATHEPVKPSTKAKKKPKTDGLRVRRETKKMILSELANLNKKESGRPITPDQYVSLAVSLIRPEHLQQLQDQSLTARDRFRRRYQEYCQQHGKVSEDEFLETLLGG